MNSSPRRPNVVFFFTDQQRWDTTGVHGNPLDLTPNFDAMARRGTHVAKSFTCQPVCGPARACLQTGLYGTASGCYRNGISLPSQLQNQTLAHYFRGAGYTTGYVGKWHLASGPSGPVRPEQRGGYEYWLASNILEFTSEPYSTELYDGNGTPVRLPGYRVDALADGAIRYIDAHQNQPFFLFLSFIEPHHRNRLDDYPAPDGYRQRYDSRWSPPDLTALGGTSQRDLGGYCGMVRRLDEALGRMMDALRSLNLLDDTIILFTSDHGSHFKTRNSEYKRSGHESSIRVPTAFCGGCFTGGGQIGELVSLIDLPPTLLDAAGIAVPPQMQGRSIVPLLHGRGGESKSWPDDVFIQISESQVARVIRTQRWKYIVTAPDKDGWKDSASDSYVEEALYDLEADPYELENLAGSAAHRPLCDRLSQRLLLRMTAAGETAPTIQPAPEKAFVQRKILPTEVDD